MYSYSSKFKATKCFVVKKFFTPIQSPIHFFLTMQSGHKLLPYLYRDILFMFKQIDVHYTLTNMTYNNVLCHSFHSSVFILIIYLGHHSITVFGKMFIPICFWYVLVCSNSTNTDWNNTTCEAISETLMNKTMLSLMKFTL